MNTSEIIQLTLVILGSIAGLFVILDFIKGIIENMFKGDGSK
jgi:hypothetical protein